MKIDWWVVFAFIAAIGIVILGFIYQDWIIVHLF